MRNKNWTFQSTVLYNLLALEISQFILKVFFHNKNYLLLKSKGIFISHMRQIFNTDKGNTCQQIIKQISVKT